MAVWILLLAAGLHSCMSSPAPADGQSQGRKMFGGYHITPRGCRGEVGVAGTCMFNYECARRGGAVVGPCMDGFLFGACCNLPDSGAGVDTEDELSEADLVTIRDPPQPLPPPTPSDAPFPDVSPPTHTYPVADTVLVHHNGSELLQVNDPDDFRPTPGSGLGNGLEPETDVLYGNEERRTTVLVTEWVPLKPVTRPTSTTPTPPTTLASGSTLESNEESIFHILSLLNDTEPDAPPAGLSTWTSAWSTEQGVTYQQVPLSTRPVPAPTVIVLSPLRPEQTTKMTPTTSTDAPEPVTSVADLANFPPVRNPQLNASFTPAEDVAEDDGFTTPQFADDDKFHDKIDTLVNKLVQSLEGNFHDLEDVLYKRKNGTATTTRRPPANDLLPSTSRRPAPSFSTTPKPPRRTRPTPSTPTRRPTTPGSKPTPTRRPTTPASNPTSTRRPTTAISKPPPTRRPTIPSPSPSPTPSKRPTTLSPTPTASRRPTTPSPSPTVSRRPTTPSPSPTVSRRPTTPSPSPTASKRPTTPSPITTTSRRPPSPRPTNVTARPRPRPTKKPTTQAADIATTTPTTTKASTTTSSTTSTTIAPTTTSTTEETTTPKPVDYRNECGVRPLMQNQVKSGRIVGGKGATFGEWPWQVLVRESTWLGLFTKNKCGGVLITSKYVVTAAHCQPGFLANLVAVLGDYDITGPVESKNSVTKNVRHVIVHRSYDAATFANDLALLELESPVQFDTHIVPICMPGDKDDFTGRMATVTGWGRLKYGGGVPSVLQEVQVPIIENSVCQEMFQTAGHSKVILNSFLCAGYANGQKDSCEGDSGGPLMLERDDGRWVLAGTVSHGIKCASPYLPGVYMRTTFYKPWLQSITGVQ